MINNLEKTRQSSIVASLDTDDRNLVGGGGLQQNKGLAWGPVHLSSSKKMKMEVVHGLASLWTVVHHQPEAIN